MSLNFYEILGVPPTASQEEITARFRELAREYHPDRHVNNPLKHLAQDHFKKITEAYETLSKPNKRASYDASLVRTASSPHYTSEQTHSGISCHRHCQEAAVATCAGCGKGLCHSCASQFTLTLCPTCLRANNRQYVGNLQRAIRTPLLVAAAGLILGFLDSMQAGPLVGLISGLQYALLFVGVYWGWPIMRGALSNNFVFVGEGAILNWFIVIVISLVFGWLIGLTVGLYRFVQTVIEFINAKTVSEKADRYIDSLEQESSNWAS